MAGLPRPPVGLLPRKNPMRPPTVRPTHNRAQSSAPTLHARTQSGAISPANSVLSNSTSASRSPVRQNGGMKRKERDFETEGGEETNIHVVVRCRGRNDRELRENSGVVVSTDGVKGKSVELSMGPSALSNKTYHFDKVFSPAADQSMIYEDVVTPLLDEMLQGYNCTIFAYGQTGTGKTYTMSGDMSKLSGLLSESAGIIPRVLHSLFGKLEGEEAESSVKCSFIELYNEELRDLLSVEENAKLKIYDDPQKKGHSATIVQGMEESHIKTADAGIRLLQDGSHKRQVAATKCNDLSSRSHTVFTVTVYMKRTAETGEEYVSAGKLNLVDLAGSENIQRSGAENKRAAEAGLINKSLLTLGRVINALVDRGSHIPYRESKLTRLLQDSLGGRTKTCIIATVSPAKSNLEETISTLDYAFRAKNIRNKPQINQMISKKTLLREFTAEIEKLKGELIAARQRHGVYLSSESYEEITVESESRRILSEEQKAKIETMETNLRNKVQELFSLTSNFTFLKKDNEATRQALDDCKGVLEKTELVLADTRQNLADETIIRKAHQTTEEQLFDAGGKLISTLSRTVHDVDGLHAKITRKSDLQSLNRDSWLNAQGQVFDVTNLIESRVQDFQMSQSTLLARTSACMQDYIHGELKAVETGQRSLQDGMSIFSKSELEVLGQTSMAKDEMNGVLEEIKVLREDVKQKVGEGLEGLSAAAGRISAGVINELEEFHTQLHTSYSSLGRDFKNLFDELVKHLNTQKSEADDLRHQLSVVVNTSIQADLKTLKTLESCLLEEREQAKADREELLEQVTSLVNGASQKQDERWGSRITAACGSIAQSQSSLKTADKTYNDSMDIWTQKENLLVEEVLKSRESLKSKMKRDWTAVNERNTSIQKTTKSVHEETVRIVDAQMKDMAVQMQALDDFVTRARSQNESHYKSHVQSLSGLSSSVKESHDSIGNHLSSSQDHVHQIDTSMTNHCSILQASLPPLTTTLRQPLSDLRTGISGTHLTEDAPTGETPRKVQYQYPTTLPRTESYNKLLANPRDACAGTLLSELPDGPPSPSKSLIYNDAPDEEVALVRPVSADGALRPLHRGLQEVSMNIHTAFLRNSDPLSLSTSIKPEAETFSSSLMGRPPLKRHATMDSRLPTGLKGGKGGAVRAEGRENLIPMTGGGGGRRLRSSQAG